MALLPANRVVVTADVDGNLPQVVLDKNTKTLIPSGPITITETAEGIKIGSTATGGAVPIDTPTLASILG